MSVAACLLLYSVAIAAAAPPLLTRMTRDGIAPHLGVAAWVAAIGSVVLSWVTVAVLLLTQLIQGWPSPGLSVISSCLANLREVISGRAGVALQVGVVAVAVMAVSTALGRLGFRLRRMRAQTHGHARMARIIGRRIDGLDAVILDAPERAAYCVAGKPHAIVLTSAALAALDERQLSAVLAHERAHLTGRHPQLLAILRGLSTTLPRVALLTIGAAEVARLLEMCADDRAARTHGSRTLLGGLLALSGPGPIPAGTLGATSIAVLDRAGRLAAPPAPAQRIRMRVLLTSVTTIITAGPLVTTALAAAGVMLCGPMAL
ncbi:M56 family metallopeptidase [Rhodococcus daqingensis]|uniref:M56 family metallopeptidase n=1 Tax=Rhodococcus daqingensis TaxID=2479363 RepID=A0ABW2S1G3_9NOCA